MGDAGCDGDAAATDADEALGWLTDGEALGAGDAAADGAGVVALESQAAATTAITSSRTIPRRFISDPSFLRPRSVVISAPTLG
jgi:hypothetical protein